MTTTHTSTPATTDAKPWPMLAAAGVGLAIVLVAIATFWDLTGNDDSGQGLPEFLVTVGIVLGGAAIVFGLVARTASASNGGQRGLVLAVLGLLTVAVFWTGLPCVFAAGAASCALTASPRGAAAKIALGIAGVTTVLAVVAAIIG